jgi:hypothetical protein
MLRQAAGFLLLLGLLLCIGCDSSIMDSTEARPATATPGLPGLPSDGVQPWERVNDRGYVQPAARQGSAFPAGSEFAPGVERFLEGGNVTDSGEASRITGTAGTLSWAMYRLVLGGAQPGSVSVDANLQRVDGVVSTYWVGVADYAANTWQLHGPFAEAQAVFTLTPGDYVSELGNAFITVIAEGEAALDVVGVAASPLVPGDTAAPPAPAAPVLAPVAGGLEVSWVPVVAADLAGYSVHYSLSPFSAAADNGVQSLPFLEGTNRVIVPGSAARLIWVGLRAVDVNGNASALSPVVSARPASGAPPALDLSVSAVSAQRNDTVTLLASGAASYDFDLDGDGTFDVTGDSTGSATLATDRTGLIRPRVRASSGDGSAVALGSVSLIVSGNQRPVASARVDVASGTPPLAVNFLGEGADFDGTIAEYAWDRTGDGIYERFTQDTTGNFSAAGLYNAKLRVTDDLGAWDVDTVSVLVQEEVVLPPPTVTLSASPNYAARNERVTFYATVSSGTVELVEWDLVGEGNYFETGTALSTWASYSESGQYLCRVRVSFEDGTQALGSMLLIVEGWAATPQPDSQDVGGTIETFMVNGRPAIIYCNDTIDNLYYVRAANADGTAWGTPVIVTNDTAGYISGAVVAGRPAVAFTDSSGFVSYVRANDSNGTSWGAPADVYNFSSFYPSLEVINGNPAISWVQFPTNKLRYARASDATGTDTADWASFEIIDDTVSATGNAALTTVNGNPAIAFEVGNNAVHYTRALDVNGATWPPTSSFVGSADDDAYVDIGVQGNGIPLILYVDTVEALVGAVGSDANGSSWMLKPILLGPDRTACTMEMIGGLPHIVYLNDTIGGLYYYTNNAYNLNGDATHEPILVDGFLHLTNSITNVSGRPGFATGRFSPLDFFLRY